MLQLVLYMKSGKASFEGMRKVQARDIDSGYWSLLPQLYDPFPVSLSPAFLSGLEKSGGDNTEGLSTAFFRGGG